MNEKKKKKKKGSTTYSTDQKKEVCKIFISEVNQVGRKGKETRHTVECGPQIDQSQHAQRYVN